MSSDQTTMEPTTREQRELARHQAWKKQQPGLQAMALAWLKHSVDVRQPWQLSFAKGAEADILPGRKGCVLELPAGAGRVFERRDYQPNFVAPDDRFTAPLANQDHHSELLRISMRLYRVAADLELRGLARGLKPELVTAWAGGLRSLAGAYRSLTGGYYLKHPPAPGKDGIELKRPETNCRQTWLQRQKLCEEWGEHDWLWAVEQVMGGHKFASGSATALPEQISDFYIEPLFVLQKWNRQRVRMINIRNAYGEVFGFDHRHAFSPQNRPLELTGEFAKAPTQFREWLQRFSSGNWAAGEKEWQALTADLNRALAWTTVEEVTQWGWHAESRSWWFGDCVLPDGEKPVKAEKQGFFRIRGEKFLIGEKDREGREWALMHGREEMLPRMHPEVTEVKRTEAAALVTELSDRLHNYVGGPDAFMAIGAVVAYAASPELMSKYRSFGGVVIHGEAGKGKGTLAGYLIAMWGYRIFTGKLPAVNVESGSIAALENALAQMSRIPFVLDEFQKDLTAKVAPIMKAAYDGTKIPKMLRGADAETSGRVPSTAPIVVGQSTSSNAAAKSRYVHVGVNEKRRRDPKGDNYERLNELSAETWRIMRYVLEHRAEYVERVVKLVDEWIADGNTRVRETRSRMIHGTAYAGYAALLELLGMPKALPADFRQWIIAESARAAGEMQEQIEIAKVWELVEQCVTLGGFTRPGEKEGESLRRIFALRVIPADVSGQELTAPTPPEAPEQQGAWEPTGTPMRWRRYRHTAQMEARELKDANGFRPGPVWVRFRLRINYKAMFAVLEQFAKQRGATVPLTSIDAARQMQGKPWFVDLRRVQTGKKERQYFTGADGGQSFWEVDLDQFDGLGYRPVPDSEWRRWSGEGLEPGEKSGLEMGEADPRLGPLYLVVDKLMQDQ